MEYIATLAKYADMFCVRCSSICRKIPSSISLCIKNLCKRATSHINFDMIDWQFAAKCINEWKIVSQFVNKWTKTVIDRLITETDLGKKIHSQTRTSFKSIVNRMCITLKLTWVKTKEKMSCCQMLLQRCRCKIIKSNHWMPYNQKVNETVFVLLLHFFVLPLLPIFFHFYYTIFPSLCFFLRTLQFQLYAINAKRNTNTGSIHTLHIVQSVAIAKRKGWWK